MTIQEIAFTGIPLPCQIIDAHTHIGPYYHSGWQEKFDCTDMPALLTLLDRLGIDSIVTAPHPLVSGNMEEANLMAADAAKKYPGRVYGYISVVPQCGMKVIKKELETYRTNPAFVGLKFLCGGYHGMLDQREYQYALDFADEMGCVVLSHVWENNPPLSQFRDALEHRRRLQLVIAHQGGGSAKQTDACLEILRDYENVSMELCGSLFNTYSVEDLAEKAGVQRLIFGTDCINLDARFDFGKVAFSCLSDREKEMIFAENYIRLLQGSQMGHIQ